MNCIPIDSSGSSGFKFLMSFCLSSSTILEFRYVRQDTHGTATLTCLYSLLIDLFVLFSGLPIQICSFTPENYQS